MRLDKMKVEKLKGILYGQAILDGLGLTTEFYPYGVAQRKRLELPDDKMYYPHNII